MDTADHPETDLPPDTLVEFVLRCLDIDDKTIADFSGPPPMVHEVYAAGWDRFAILWDLIAKRLIAERCRDQLKALRDLEAQPPGEVPALDLTVAQVRAQEAGRAFAAVAGTYRDRHGYGRAARGLQGDAADLMPQPAGRPVES